MEDFPGVVRMGGSARRDGPEVVPSRDGMGVGAADTPGSLGSNPTGTHRTILTADAILSEFTMRSLIFRSDLPRFPHRQHRQWPLSEAVSASICSMVVKFSKVFKILSFNRLYHHKIIPELFLNLLAKDQEYVVNFHGRPFFRPNLN